jgi:2-oxo-4-hydroxy-4-carboxy--5-ureidoimidazoline (OHCU) decarboxylase
LADRKPTRAEFVTRYGSIYEHSPWVAAESYEEAAGMDDPDRLAEIFEKHVNAADRDTKLALIRAHPDLAGKAAVGAHAEGNRADLEPGVGLRTATAGDHPLNDLTPASRQEQQSAALDQCTPEEYKQFHKLNCRYKEKFGFPFIMAVRGSNRQEILSAFTSRLENDPETEFTTAMQEIHKIAKLRLKADAP